MARMCNHCTPCFSKFCIHILYILILFISCFDFSNAIFDPSHVKYAINCGGDAHTDIFGVRYERDPLKTGHAHIDSQNIRRTPKHDMILYQSERWNENSFTYKLNNIHEDGQYVLILKFSEVYFKAPNQKIFNIKLNQDVIIPNLDIFTRSGFCQSHDEYIPFTISGDKAYVETEFGKTEIDIMDGLFLTLEKIEPYDNPKINAFYIYKGSRDDVPKLPPIEEDDYMSDPLESDEEYRKRSASEYEDGDEEEFENLDVPHNLHKADDEIITRDQKQRIDLLKRANMLRDEEDGDNLSYEEEDIKNPYDEDSSSLLIPVVICVAAFVPILYLLCKI